MYVSKRVGLIQLLERGWRTLLLIFVVVSAVTGLYLEFLEDDLHVSINVVTALSTALSFFIAFFTAQAYDRWWEARKIWGTLVNDSRSFARMVLTFFGRADPEIDELQRRMVRRHLAYLYAVKQRLRGESRPEYTAYLSDEDLDRVNGLSHVGNALLELQGRDLDAAERAGQIDVIRMAQLNDMLSRFSTSMGMAERIKTTVFPAYYAAMIRVSIWASVLVFAVALSDQVGYWAIPFSTLMGTIFALIYRLGAALLEPFEGRPNDTPMSSIVRNIEINLLEQIGEEKLPSPVEPVDGKYLL